MKGNDQMLDIIMSELFKDLHQSKDVYYDIFLPTNRKVNPEDQFTMSDASYYAELLKAEGYVEEVESGIGGGLAIILTPAGINMMDEYGSYLNFLSAKQMKTKDENNSANMEMAIRELDLKIKRLELAEKGFVHKKVLGKPIFVWVFWLTAILTLINLYFTYSNRP